MCSGDDTHNKKQPHTNYIFTTKGMIPIAKNIIVVDEQGNEYEATYPKRAKGLVKNGRARFVNENTICLACPPDNVEDNTMSDNTNNNIPVKSEDKISMNYILEQIEKISLQTEHLNNAIAEISKMGPGGPGNMAEPAKAEAISDIVKCRETTNQKLLALYEKMYDDLNPAKALKLQALYTIEHIADSGKLTEEELEVIGGIINDVIR